MTTALLDTSSPQTSGPKPLTEGKQPVGMVVADLGSQVTQPDGSTAFGPPDGHPDLIVADGGNESTGGATTGVSGVYFLPGLVDSLVRRFA